MAAKKKTKQTSKKYSSIPPALLESPATLAGLRMAEAAAAAVEPMHAEAPAPAVEATTTTTESTLSVTSMTLAGATETVVVTDAGTTDVADTHTVAVPAPVADLDSAVVAEPATEAPAPAADATPDAATPAVDVAGLMATLRGPSAEDACEAAEALGSATGDRWAVAALCEVLASADGFFHPIVRAAAAASLGRLGDVAALPALAAATRDPMAEASAEAVRALATLGDRSAVPALVEIVRNRDGFFLPVVRRAAVLALVHLGGPAAIATLEAVAADGDEDAVVRLAAVGQAA